MREGRGAWQAVRRKSTKAQNCKKTKMLTALGRQSFLRGGYMARI
jgi:hypothetical protein